MGNNRKASNTIEQGLQIQHRAQEGGDKYKRAGGYKYRRRRGRDGSRYKAVEKQGGVYCKQNGSLSSSKGVRLGLGVKKLSVSKLQLADEPLVVLVPPE